MSILSESELQLRCRLVDAKESFAHLDWLLAREAKAGNLDAMTTQARLNLTFWAVSLRKVLTGSAAPLTEAEALATLQKIAASYAAPEKKG